jgi:CRISPR/Cas system-associated exonuclease Cas4 (RecB family)
MKKVKREDGQITELASQIKEKEEIIKDKIDTLKEEMKAIREEDKEFVELKENKKALEDGYRDEMKRRRAHRDYLYETMQRMYQE